MLFIQCWDEKKPLLNKMEIHSCTFFSPHFKLNGNKSLDMFRHVYSNADTQMPASASLDMFIQMAKDVYSNV